VSDDLDLSDIKHHAIRRMDDHYNACDECPLAAPDFCAVGEELYDAIPKPE